MKRGLSAALILCVLCLLAACGSTQTPTPTTLVAATTVTTSASLTSATTPATTNVATPTTSAAATESATAATAETTPLVTEEAAPVFSAQAPWEWWDQSETIAPYFSAAYQVLDETEPWSVLRVLGEDAYVPLEPLAEEIVADTYNAVFVQFWDVSEMQGRELHNAWMYTDDVMRQMILADRGQFWRIESEALYDYFTEQALTFGRIGTKLAGEVIDAAQIGFHDGSGSDYPIVTDMRLSYFCDILAEYAWVIPEQSDLPLTGMEYTVHLYAPDGSDLTVFAGSDFVRWRDANGTRWYHLQPKQPNAGWEQGMLAAELRLAYAGAVASCRQISFFHQGTPEEVVGHFATVAYGDNLLQVPNGTVYSVLDYAVIGYRIDRVAEDGKTIVGGFGFAVQPETAEENVFLAGNGQLGSDEYEGWIIASRNFRLVMGEDGLWRCDEMATGRLE